MAEIQIGLVGTGFVADIHARAYKEIHGIQAQIVAAAATSLESARAFASQHGIPNAYADYRDILDRNDVDIVDICTPNAVHEPIAIAAAQAGKHVICEKPLTGYFGGPEAAEPVGRTLKSLMAARALDSADRMIAAAHASGTKLMYAENWLYCPAVQRAAELAAAAGGAIFEIRAEESHSGSHARYAKRWAQAGGGSLMRLAPHPIGAALYLKQQEGMRRSGVPIHPLSVTAEVGHPTRMASFQAEGRHWIVKDWQDVESWGALIIAFEDGARAVIHASDVALGGIETLLQVSMSNGRIQCDMSHSGLVRAFVPDAAIWGDAYLMEKVDHKGGWSYPSTDEHWMLGYPHEMQDFVEAVAWDRQPRSTAELGRQVVQVIYAAYQSAEEGRRITLAGSASA
jgi:predicted dehydrogenase